MDFSPCKQKKEAGCPAWLCTPAQTLGGTSEKVTVLKLV